MFVRDGAARSVVVQVAAATEMRHSVDTAAVKRSTNNVDRLVFVTIVSSVITYPFSCPSANCSGICVRRRSRRVVTFNPQTEGRNIHAAADHFISCTHGLGSTQCGADSFAKWILPPWISQWRELRLGSPPSRPSPGIDTSCTRWFANEQRGPRVPGFVA